MFFCADYSIHSVLNIFGKWILNNQLNTVPLNNRNHNLITDINENMATVRDGGSHKCLHTTFAWYRYTDRWPSNVIKNPLLSIRTSCLWTVITQVDFVPITRYYLPNISPCVITVHNTYENGTRSICFTSANSTYMNVAKSTNRIYNVYITLDIVFTTLLMHTPLQTFYTMIQF